MYKDLTIQTETRQFEHMDGGSIECSKCGYLGEDFTETKLKTTARKHLRDNPTHTVTTRLFIEHQITYGVTLKPAVARRVVANAQKRT